MAFALKVFFGFILVKSAIQEYTVLVPELYLDFAAYFVQGKVRFPLCSDVSLITKKKKNRPNFYMAVHKTEENIMYFSRCLELIESFGSFF